MKQYDQIDLVFCISLSSESEKFFLYSSLGLGLDRCSPGGQTSPHEADQTVASSLSSLVSSLAGEQGEGGEATVTATPPVRLQVLLTVLLLSLSSPALSSSAEDLVELVPSQSNIQSVDSCEYQMVKVIPSDNPVCNVMAIRASLPPTGIQNIRLVRQTDL